jgi:hypothetical protein
VALAEQLTLARAALEDTPRAAPPLVRLQSVSEIPVGFEFVRGHGRQGAVLTTPPRRKVMRDGKDRCGTERMALSVAAQAKDSTTGNHRGMLSRQQGFAQYCRLMSSRYT